jgi:dihydropteroate synthase
VQCGDAGRGDVAADEVTGVHPSGLPPAIASLDRTVVMGVLNVTPDSFSDGGRWLDPMVAVAHGIRMHRLGADIVDVGGESTRPGAGRIDSDEESRRVLPVVQGLIAAGVPVSIDTTRAVVARAATAAGACMVNDVSGGLADPHMVPWVATQQVPYVVMHWRGPSAHMADLAHYDDVVLDVRRELAGRLAALDAAGVDLGRVVVDPGLGFAKDADHNWALLNGLGHLADLGRPVLIGASRKRFLGSLLADPDGTPRSMDRRDYASDAITALAAAAGAWCVRVHDVVGSRDAVAVARAWSRGHA